MERWWGALHWGGTEGTDGLEKNQLTWGWQRNNNLSYSKNNLFLFRCFLCTLLFCFIIFPLVHKAGQKLLWILPSKPFALLINFPTISLFTYLLMLPIRFSSWVSLPPASPAIFFSALPLCSPKAVICGSVMLLQLDLLSVSLREEEEEDSDRQAEWALEQVKVWLWIITHPPCPCAVIF